MPSVENEHVGDATLLLVDLEGDDRADTADTVAFLKQLCPEAGGRALELGVGLGRIAIPLVQAGGSVVGVELSEQIAAELVRLKGPRTRCRRCVGALPGPRSVGAADGTSALQVTSRRT